MDFDVFVNYYNQLPFLIKVVWIISVILFIIIIVSIFYLKIYRTRLRNSTAETQKLVTEYEIQLINYLYAEEGQEEQNSIIEKLTFCISSKSKRKIIKRVLLKLKKEISGEIAVAIQNLYRQIGLLNFALKKLDHQNWYVVAMGIRELKQFNIKDAHDAILHHVNHSSKEVRKEVQLYLVSLFHFKGLEFLTKIETDLSEWDQIQLLEVLQKNEDQQDVDITPWLNSNNDSVVMFSLKIAEIFNQYEVQNHIIELLHHKNNIIRTKAILVLGGMQNLDFKHEVMNNFEERTLEEQQALFKIFEPLVSNNDEWFLLKYSEHYNFEIRLEALRLIKNFSPDKFALFKETTNNGQFLEMLNFLTDN
ncbi:hypothetical protein [Lutibacter sp.]|uniref:hypothetical protein n=1 Tax=Lutibacter sp. TaxID=1925666 RepID=UPI0027352109|nr:hypothetical protein [Lutibacter sp.]MDP3312698.1 hypothetical protein [Lutibacter sp.]